MRSKEDAPVTVIIPCYRCGDTIKWAVSSVANQSWRPSEVILIDDASDDGTLAVLRNLQSQYGVGWVKIIRKEVNEGPGAARNTGWEVAAQPYIAFLDADDAWHPHKLEIQMRYMLEHPELAIMGHRWAWISSKSGKSKIDTYLPETFRVIPISFRKLLFSNVLATPTVILKRELPHRFDTCKRFSEDYLLWLSILADGYKGALIDLPLAFIYKAPYGEGGLSGKLWKMERGELETYWRLHCKGKISLPTFCALATFSLAKYARRCLKVWLWKSIR